MVSSTASAIVITMGNAGGDGGMIQRSMDPDGVNHSRSYSIGEAARLTGVSRGLLRIWERERLIRPNRTAGGHRAYSATDLGRLAEIARLRQTERLNAAAIRRELGAADGGADGRKASADSAEPPPGERLRAIRTERGWSLATVAARSGLSVSFLSAVERGQANASVGTLFKLADAYGTTVPGLGRGVAEHGRPLLHPDERPRYVAGSGRVVIEDLITHPEAIEAQRIDVHPDGGSDEFYAHPGEEFVYVLTGELVFVIAGDHVGERYRLRAGDSLSFRSMRPHRWWNDGETTASVLWINAPRVETASGAPSLRRTTRRRSSPNR